MHTHLLHNLTTYFSLCKCPNSTQLLIPFVSPQWDMRWVYQTNFYLLINDLYWSGILPTSFNHTFWDSRPDQDMKRNWRQHTRPWLIAPGRGIHHFWSQVISKSSYLSFIMGKICGRYYLNIGWERPSMPTQWCYTSVKEPFYVTTLKYQDLCDTAPPN